MGRCRLSLSTSRALIFALLVASLQLSSSLEQRKQTAGVYIVQVSKADKPAVFASHSYWYSSMLASVKGLQATAFEDERDGPIYVYDTAFHGFAAKLTPDEAKALEKTDGFLTVLPDTVAQLDTTRTPEFMGLNTAYGLWPASDFGDDVIIGVFDTGVWPERKSFGDLSLGPVPAKWNGTCEAGTAFTPMLCNRKLIGARAFFKGYESAAGPINETREYRSPRDSDGHGTHTASTAAGNYVYDASLLGSASGTARGIATRARIAVYKVCWDGGCFGSDLLYAFEQALLDGVDIISLSVGGSSVPYFLDPISTGSFAALEKGVLVSCSAGNSGPSLQSVGNVAPWLLTVAASTLDRDFPAPVTLGNGKHYTGVSLNDANVLGDRQVPLIYAGHACLSKNNASCNLCLEGTLDPAVVKGKMVVCDRGINARTAKGMVVKEAGGAGMILANSLINGNDLTADCHVLPAAIVDYNSGVAIKEYIALSPNPTAGLTFLGTVLGVKPAPCIAAFSSRGPNPINPQILKPDVTAPGVNILAAWTGKVGPSGLPGDTRVVDFNIISGTSMSCPHASGLAALLKGSHPDWSPAAIKSALMTTAFNVDNTGKIIMDASNSNPCNAFCYGAGHVDAVRSLNPGLVYDLGVQDYVDFLCSLNYPARELQGFIKGRYSCPKKSLGLGSLNYPTLSFVYDQDRNSSKYVATYTRTVTNVGTPISVYTVNAIAPAGVEMKIEPTTLSFTRINEKQSYTVTCAAISRKLVFGEIDYSFGSLVWSNEEHKVQSQIVFQWQNFIDL